VSVQTSGVDPDDGYDVRIGDRTAVRIPTTTGTASFPNVAVGVYAVVLSDLASNCIASPPGPVSVTVSANALAHAQFRVTCEGIPSSVSIGWRFPSLLVGDTAQLQARVLAREGSEIPGTRVTWVASSPAAASISSGGVVLGQARGGTWIRAQFAALVDSVEVRVLEASTSTRRELAYLTTDGGTPWRLVRTRSDGSGFTSLWHGDFSDWEWSPDGAHIIAGYAAPGTNRLVTRVHDANGALVRDFDRFLWTARYSPDGRSIVYRDQVSSGESDVWHLDLATGNERRLTSAAGDDIQPRWSPDGRQVLYIREPRQETQELWVVSADTVHRRKLPLSLTLNSAEWSPDGKHILTVRSTSVGIVHADGTVARSLTLPCAPQVTCAPTDLVGDARWTPNGRAIAVLRQDVFKTAYYAEVALDGTPLMATSFPGLGINVERPGIAFSADGNTVGLLLNPEPNNGYTRPYVLPRNATSMLPLGSFRQQHRIIGWRP